MLVFELVGPESLDVAVGEEEVPFAAISEGGKAFASIVCHGFDAIGPADHPVGPLGVGGWGGAGIATAAAIDEIPKDDHGEAVFNVLASRQSVTDKDLLGWTTESCRGDFPALAAWVFRSEDEGADGVVGNRRAAKILGDITCNHRREQGVALLRVLAVQILDHVICPGFLLRPTPARRV